MDTSKQMQTRRRTLEEVDNYVQTIEVLIALSTIFNEFGGKSVISKSLKVKGKNISINPDLVTEFSDTNSGILAESKTSLPMDHKLWKDDVKQLKGYDQELEEWKTEIKQHDIVFITDTILTKKFWDYITQLSMNDPKFHFERNLNVCQFSRQEKVNVLLVVRKDYGSFSNSSIDKVLGEGKRISLKNIIREIDSTKFYDARPNVIYTMEIMWDFVFPKQISEKDYRYTPLNRSITINMSLDEIVDFLRKYFGPKNNPEVIKKAWIREAMDKFVEVNLAQSLGNETYSIQFRKTVGKKVTRNYLLNLVYPENETGQTKLDFFAKQKKLQQK